MKDPRKNMRDPRPWLLFFMRLPILLIAIFYIYRSIATGKVISMTIFISIAIVLLFISIIFFRTKKTKYKDIVLVGYIVGGTLAFLTVFYTIASVVSARSSESVYSLWSLVITTTLLILSVTIIYLSNRSKYYEEKVLT